MKLSADSPIRMVVVHEKLGCGVLRYNASIEQQGRDFTPSAPHRLIAIQFSDSSAWHYVRPGEEFTDVLSSTAASLGKA
jgi:hypothetical protein